MPKFGSHFKMTSDSDSEVVIFQVHHNKKKITSKSSTNKSLSEIRTAKSIGTSILRDDNDEDDDEKNEYEDDDQITPLLFDTTTSKSAVKTFSKKKGAFAVSTNSFLGKAQKYNFDSSGKRSEISEASKDVSESDNDFDNIEQRIRDKIVQEREKNEQSKNTYFKSYNTSSVLPQSSFTKPARMRGEKGIVERDIYDFADSDSDKKAGVFSRPKTETKRPSKRKAKSDTSTRRRKSPKIKANTKTKKRITYFNDNASENSERSNAFGSQVSDTSEATKGGQSPGGTHLTVDISWDGGHCGKKTYSAPIGYTIQPLPSRKGLKYRDDNIMKKSL